MQVQIIQKLSVNEPYRFFHINIAYTYLSTEVEETNNLM